MRRKPIIQIKAEEAGKTIPEIIVEALNTHETNIEAAASLGVAYRTLWSYMKRYNIVKVCKYQVEKPL